MDNVPVATMVVDAETDCDAVLVVDMVRVSLSLKLGWRETVSERVTVMGFVKEIVALTEREG